MNTFTLVWLLLAHSNINDVADTQIAGQFQLQWQCQQMAESSYAVSGGALKYECIQQIVQSYQPPQSGWGSGARAAGERLGAALGR